MTEMILFKSLKSKLITLCLVLAFTLYWFRCKLSSMEQVPPCTPSRATNPPPARQSNVPMSPACPCTSLGEDVCPPFLSQVRKNTLGSSLQPLTLPCVSLGAAIAPQAGTVWGLLPLGTGMGTGDGMSPIFSSFGVCPVLWGAGSGYTCGSNRVSRNVIAVGQRERSEFRGQPFGSGREEERDKGLLTLLTSSS